MLSFLFRGLTAERAGAAALFDRATFEARQPHWFIEGKVPDTLDGRFGMLATILALVLVRLERDGSPGDHTSVALTERFIHVMESEHRELGLGDPTLGKTVRKLVAMLARRTELWRTASAGEGDWLEATRDSLYKGPAAPDVLRHSAKALNEFRLRLEATSLAELEQGAIA
jgi:cytochrome b pre-mRNA-processing protein 3